MSPDVKAAHDRLTKKVMGREGVTGTAIGESGGRPCLLVYLASDDARKGIPSAVDGVPVRVEVTGAFRRR